MTPTRSRPLHPSFHGSVSSVSNALRLLLTMPKLETCDGNSIVLEVEEEP